jgi:hypothetical protein
MSLPKLVYNQYDRCVILVGDVPKVGCVIADFTTPHAIETQYIIQLDDVTHPNYEVRDALRMRAIDVPTMPSGDRLPAANSSHA